jgi:two-component system response regulator RegA
LATELSGTLTSFPASNGDSGEASSKPWVLIADPSAGSRRRLVDGFQGLGYAVAESQTISETFLLAFRRKPVLIAMETQLDDGSALRILKHLIGEIPRTTIVIVTAYASVANAIRAIRAGARDYLPKPVTAQQILQALQEPPEESVDRGIMTLSRAMWEYVHVVYETSPSLAEAARRLGLDRRSLRRKLGKYAP